MAGYEMTKERAHDDFIGALHHPGALAAFVELLRAFSPHDTPTDGLIAGAFYGDPCFEQRFGNATDPLIQAVGLCFLVDSPWRSYSDREAFARWQQALQNLLRLRDVSRLPVPIYGWAMFGVHLSARLGRPRIRVRLAPGRACWADECPPTLDRLLALPGVDDDRTVLVERQLTDALLEHVHRRQRGASSKHQHLEDRRQVISARRGTSRSGRQESPRPGPAAHPKSGR